MTTPYDTVPYPTQPRMFSHPGHLYAVARMYGVPAATPATCRVLEVGCGEATHLIACAAAMPDATFVGVDLSAEAIARGNKLVERVGLTNIKLMAADITAWDAPPESFDYALAHGLYSWVPPAVRDALMALMRRVLTQHGIGYVSYNAYPGCYIRRMLWDMMKYHVGGATDPRQMIDQSMKFVEFLRTCRPIPEGARPGLFDEDLDIVLNKRVANVLYHDDLSPVNDPVYFKDFAAHAARFDLSFVSETEPYTMGNEDIREQAADVFRTLSKENPLKREQYYDFVTLRRFRQTMLARAPHQPCGTADPDVIRELYACGAPKYEALDLAPDRPMRFFNDTGTMTTTLPLAKAALVALGEHNPHLLSYPELLAAARRKLGRDAVTDAEERELRQDLLAAWHTDLISLRGFSPAFVKTVSDRPVASPLARVQLADGNRTTTMLHLQIAFDDPPASRMVQLLDGTRTVAEVGQEVYKLLPPANRPSEADFHIGLTRNLAMLAKNGLLVG